MITQDNLHQRSLLNGLSGGFDYIDTYESVCETDGKLISANDLARAFLLSAPQWVSTLMRVRNSIASKLGLKTTNTENEDAILATSAYEPGEKFGLFEIFGKTQNEIVLGANDVHLNFRVSLLSTDTNVINHKLITISTTVKFNNVWGKLYFLPVKPFHRAIVPAMLNGMISRLASKE
jgi:hypothetical protein